MHLTTMGIWADMVIKSMAATTTVTILIMTQMLILKIVSPAQVQIAKTMAFNDDIKNLMKATFIEPTLKSKYANKDFTLLLLGDHLYLYFFDKPRPKQPLSHYAENIMPAGRKVDRGQGFSPGFQ